MGSAGAIHKKCSWSAAVLLILLPLGNLARGAVGPYAPDADTLHLWHMDERSAPVNDFRSDGTRLGGLGNGATLGNPSYNGFGGALSTYGDGPDAATDAGRGAYLSARPLVNGPKDNVKLSYTGPTGAFTYEAIVRIDFDPQANLGAKGRATPMEIISLDADETLNRVCQFRLVPIGLSQGNTQPLLEFVNLNQDKAPQSLTAPIPTTGPDAIRLKNWYHVAVAYDGSPNQPDNLRFYWTLLNPNRAAANLIGSGQMVNSLPSGCAPDFAIGQNGYQSSSAPRPNENFIGLIDEVRLSGVARSAAQLMFGSRTVVASAGPANPAVPGSNPAAPASSPAASSSSPAARGSSPATASPNPGLPKTSSAAQDTNPSQWAAKAWLIAGALAVLAGLSVYWGFMLRRRALRVSAALQSAGGSAVGQLASARASSPYGAGSSQSYGGASARGTVQGLQSQSGLMRQGKRPKLAEQRARSETDFGPEETDAAGAPGETGFRGVLRAVGLQDLIQLECLNGKSSMLEISNESLQGRIYIERGEIVHAVAGGLSGQKALNQLLSLPGGRFTHNPFEPPGERTLHGPWIELLLEAAYTHDEEARPASEAGDIAFTASGGGTEDVLTMATLLQDHPQVREVLVCSNEGKALHSSRCPDVAGRTEICSTLFQTARAASELLPLGELRRLEIVNGRSTTILTAEQGCCLLVGIERDAALP